jgi:hypothetical protein
MASEKVDMYEHIGDAKLTATGEDHASQQDDAEPEPFTHSETRKIVHKIDRRLLSICGLMVAVSLMDRSNLSNAYIAGYVTTSILSHPFRLWVLIDRDSMGKDLELTLGTRYVSTDMHYLRLTCLRPTMHR